MVVLTIPVRCMMYGFGDVQVPYIESVDILEDLVIEYIIEMVCILRFIIQLYYQLNAVCENVN